jgi:DNA polymerase-3 subunit gamma/tau
MLSQAAFNAFLKTLEEPPAYAKFILATTEKHKILPTILSRCQIFDFRRISVEDIAGYLEYVAKNEHVEAEEEALHVIAQKADGALRDALSTFDQIVSYSGDKLTYKNVIENLNILDYEYYFKVTTCILNNDIPKLLLIFNEIIENGFDGQHFITGLSEHLRNLLVIKDPKTLELLLASASLKEKYNGQAAACSPQFLISALNTCNTYDLSYKTSNNKKLHIEIALMQLTQLIGQQEDQPEIKKKANAPGEEKPVYKKKEEPEESKPLKPVVSKTAKKAAVKENSKGIKNISIKGSLQALRQKQDPEEATNEPVIKNNFDQERLSQVWAEFIEGYQKKSPSFANAIAKYDPVLREHFKIEYKVDNILIAKDVLNVTSLLEFLKKELKNNQIKLQAVLPEKSEKKTAYTDRERFEEMAKKYPGIVKLKDQLNLELEL